MKYLISKQLDIKFTRDVINILDSLIDISMNIQLESWNLLKSYDTSKVTLNKLINDLCIMFKGDTQEYIDGFINIIAAKIYKQFMMTGLISSTVKSSITIPAVHILPDSIFTIYSKIYFKNTIPPDIYQQRHSIVITRDSSHGFYVNLFYISEFKEDMTIVAVDVDSFPYTCTSSGHRYDNPSNYTNAVLKLNKYSETLARRKLGSKLYSETSLKIKEIQNKLSNIKRDVWHKGAVSLICCNSLIVIEKRRRPGSRSNSLDSSIYCSNRFINILRQKAAQQGIPVLFVNNDLIKAKVWETECPYYNKVSEYIEKYPEVRLRAMQAIGEDFLKYSKQHMESDTAWDDI